MPYINYLFCEVCGVSGNLDLDYIKTIESYIADGRKSTTLDDRAFIWDYIVYSCLLCNRQYRYTYKDVEHQVRSFFQRTAGDLMKEIMEAQVTEEDRKSGLFFVQKSSSSKDRVHNYYSKNGN